jgi:hypothetical protein
MSEVRGGTGARGNPPPRRALSRVRPLDAEDGPGSGLDAGAAATSESAATAPGGTEGRDLLIPGHGKAGGKGHGRAKNGRPVPSLADLMPPAAPTGRRQGEGSGSHHHKSDQGKSGKSAELSVRLSKSVRKQLKARAAELGLSPEDTVAQLVEVWLES